MENLALLPGLAAALLAFKARVEASRVVLHDQEHVFEADRVSKLEDFWNELNDTLWSPIHHKTLKRAIQLGGEPARTSHDEAEAFGIAIREFEGAA